MASATPVTDHDEIREWVESRGGRPACVKGTAALLRIDFAQPDEKLQPIEWDQWFDTFDSRRLAAIIQEKGRSRFIKLVDRNEASGRGRSKTRGARSTGARGTRQARSSGAQSGRSASNARKSTRTTAGSRRGASSGRVETRSTGSTRGRASTARDAARSGAAGRKRAVKKR